MFYFCKEHNDTEIKALTTQCLGTQENSRPHPGDLGALEKSFVVLAEHDPTREHPHLFVSSYPLNGLLTVPSPQK